MAIDKYLKYFNEEGLFFGRLLSRSKSLYRKKYPKNLVIFNARIYLKSHYEKEKDNKIKDFFAGMDEEIWYGDLDLTLDLEILKKVKNKIGEPIVITTEHGRKIKELI